MLPYFVVVSICRGSLLAFLLLSNLHVAQNIRSKDKLFERLVFSLKDFLVGPFPFGASFIDERDIFANADDRVHVVGVDNRRDIVFVRDARYQFIDDD